MNVLLLVGNAVGRSTCAPGLFAILNVGFAVGGAVGVEVGKGT